MAAKADPDGILRLTIPVGMAGCEFEVAVVVSPRPTANGTGQAKTPAELGWPPGYFENVIGSIDDEAFVAPARHPPEPVEPIE
jgi:hypothetical protein